jgi:uncharacterized protein YjiS (DUF1127 family)
MKITEGQLRKIIRQEIAQARKRKKLHEAVGHTAELTDPGITRDDIYEAWPEGVTHNGKSVFKTYYSDQVTGPVYRMLQGASYEDSQEVYLGYSPDADSFFMGFDTWESYEDEWGYEQPGDEMSAVVVKLHPGGKTDSIVVQSPGSMYPSGLRELKRRYPDIVDVRLD